MKKIAMLLVVLLLSTMTARAGDPAKITFMDLADHFLSKTVNKTVQIQWKHSAWFDINLQTCRIHARGTHGSNGDFIVSQVLQVTSDSFTWTSGMKADGTYIPEGWYRLAIVSAAYDTGNEGPEFTFLNEEARITITAPAHGENPTLVIGTKYWFRWTHNSYYDFFHQVCQFMWDDNLNHSGFISGDVSVTDNQFEWTVGRKKDGTYLSPGNYAISLENIDCDRGVGAVTLVSPDLRVPIRRLVERIPLYKDPGCPMCFHLNPGDLKFDPAEQGPVTLEIVRGRQVLARLGRFGRGLAVPGLVHITLDQESHGFLMRGQQGFELRVLAADGSILQQQAIMLEIVK